MDALFARQAELQDIIDATDAWNLDSKLERAMDALRCTKMCIRDRAQSVAEQLVGVVSAGARPVVVGAVVDIFVFVVGEGLPHVHKAATMSPLAKFRQMKSNRPESSAPTSLSATSYALISGCRS